MNDAPTKFDQKEYLRQWHIKNRDRRRIAAKERRHANPAAARARAAAFRKKNPDSMRRAYRKWRLKNKAHVAARMREYRKAHAAELKEWRKHNYQKRRATILQNQGKWRNENRGKLRASHRAYRLANLDRKRQQVREYHRIKSLDPEWKSRKLKSERESYHRHKPKRLQRHKKWRKNNPHKLVEYRLRRRSLEAAATINLAGIKEWIGSVKSQRQFRCYYCKEKFPIKKVHFDHIVALANGGAHSVENLCASCPTCNLSKSDKPIRTWIRVGQQVMEL